jgi:hypothetical protein
MTALTAVGRLAKKAAIARTPALNRPERVCHRPVALLLIVYQADSTAPTIAAKP